MLCRKLNHPSSHYNWPIKIMEPWGCKGGYVAYHEPNKGLSDIPNARENCLYSLVQPWMKQEILIQGLFRVGWRLIRAYQGLIQGLKDKPWISLSPNLICLPPQKKNTPKSQKIPPTPNVPNHPPILTQTFPDPLPRPFPSADSPIPWS